MRSISEKLYPLLKEKESDLGIKNLKIISQRKFEEGTSEIIGSKMLAIVTVGSETYIIWGDPESKALKEKDLEECLSDVDVKKIEVIK